MMGSVGVYTDMENISFDDVLGQGGSYLSDILILILLWE
jgi:hypothetical protein